METDKLKESSSSDEMDTSEEEITPKKTTPKKKNKPLPPEIEDYKSKVRIRSYAPTQSSTIDYHGAFKNLGYDNSFSMEEFKETFQIKIQELTNDTLVFDMIGVDAAIANAFRRILIAEVPTMAIEHVVVVNNTSLLQDEILAHRLGLIPIKADPRRFKFKPGLKKKTFGYGDEEMIDIEKQPLYENETLLFKLKVTCKKDPKRPQNFMSVYSKQIEWIPIGNQKETFKDDPIRPVFDDILIAKLRPGQVIDVECYAQKGIGEDHAKYSPVSTATYRLLPDIELMQKIKGDDAEKLVNKCPMKVFDIEDGEAIVARPRDCTFCRECIREEEWEKKVKLSKVKNHFIFSIESTGILPPEEIFREALRVFYQKCSYLRDELRKLKKKKKKTKKVFN